MTAHSAAESIGVDSAPHEILNIYEESICPLELRGDSSFPFYFLIAAQFEHGCRTVVGLSNAKSWRLAAAVAFP